LFGKAKFLCSTEFLALINVQAPKYHIYIEYAEAEKSGIRFNVTQEELVRTFATPFTAGQPFWFMGNLLNPVKVTQALLFWSYETADKLTLPNQEKLVVAKDKKYLIENILKSKVKGAYLCTEKFLYTSQKNAVAAQSFASDMRGISRRIFVVSGEDDEMKKAITWALTRIGLVPVVLCEEPSQGRKIVEHFKDYADVGFALVLLSPDDYVYGIDEAPTKRKLSPAQKVVFQLGFLSGKLGNNKVLIFFRECTGFEVTHFEGLNITPFDDRESWKLSLIRELTNNGYSVDAAGIIK
jgi:predicted nucleotide-binding protein